MDRARQAGADRHHHRRHAYRLIPAVLVLCAGACRDFLSAPDRIIAIEVTTPAPKVEEGDTLRLQARGLNGAGTVVTGATVTWATDDSITGFTLDKTSGLVTGVKPGTWTARVFAVIDKFQSDGLTLMVTPQPDTIAAATTRITMTAQSSVSPPLAVTVYDRTTHLDTLTGITGKPVAFQVILPATGGGFFLTRDSLAGADPRAATALTVSTGVAQVTARRVTGQAQPDSAVVEARVTTARGVAVAGSPIRFVILFPTN